MCLSVRGEHFVQTDTQHFFAVAENDKCRQARGQDGWWDESERVNAAEGRQRDRSAHK